LLRIPTSPVSGSTLARAQNTNDGHQLKQPSSPGLAHGPDLHREVPCYPLIEAGDAPPYLTYNDKGSAPVLLVADHASPFFPAAMNQLGLADWVLDRHVTWDIGSDQLTRHLADLLDAPAILAGFSRLIIDPNRQLDDPTAFVEISDGISIPGNRALSAEQKALRIQSFFEPYHGAIARRLGEFSANGIVPALISVHTCTPVFAEFIRPWHIGVMWDKDPRIAQPMMEKLRKVEGVCFGDNEPYSGRHSHDFTIDHHAESVGLAHVGIEVRQDLVRENEGARKWAGILAAALKDVLADETLYRYLDTSTAATQGA
jgi:predicted N-formylglutamate amidohydrolase